jgi:hypothetical protein
MRSLFLTGRLVPVCLFALFPMVNAQAGLFDFLNQSAPEPQRTLTIERPAPANLPPIQPLPQYKVEPPRHITVVHENTQEKAPILERQSPGLIKDPTLRDGDAVMTQHGIRIFAASFDGRRPNDFVTLAETKGLTLEERTALAEIDAHRSEEGWQSKSAGHDQLITGRSAANTAHAWKWLRDPKGHLVRYVGP